MLVCILCVTSFSSCEKAGTELSDLMIIQGIGVDYKNGQYTVTVEILNNEQSGSPSGDASSDNKTKIYNAQGESVGGALMKLTTKSGNKPFYAHNRVIVLGEGVINKDLEDVIDFFENISYNKTDTYESEKENEICFVTQFCRAFPRGRSYA